MELHYSSYNHLLSLGDGSYLLYNFLSGKQMKLDEFSLAFFNHALDKDENHPYCVAFRKRGFLVDYDEVEFLRVRTNASLSGGPVLDVVLCPTLACNLRCTYCFEQNSEGCRGTMGEEVQEAVLRLLEKTLQTRQYQELNLEWYGGEPLLGMEIIERMSRRVLDFCEQLGVKYSASMITNGTLLTPELAEKLYELQVRKLQITLDGPRCVHDLSRPAANGESSFDAITANLRSLRTPLKIDIRCNLHQNNAPFVRELKALSEELNAESGADIRFYTAGMKAVPGDRQSAALEIPPEQFMSEGRPVDENMLERRSISCGKLKASSLTIDSNGALYKCERMVGVPEASFGNVLECTGEWMSYLLSEQPKRDVLTRWMRLAFPDDEECLQCKVLPLCMGGCSADRLDGKKHCNRARYDMDSYVRLVTNLE